jgi:hypothetical protein
MPKGMRADARYCSDTHRKSAAAKRARLRKKAQRGELITMPLDHDITKSIVRERGTLVKELESSGLANLYFANEVTLEEMSRQLNVKNRSQIKRALDQLLEDRLNATAASTWVMADDIQHMLGLDLVMPEPLDVEACKVWAGALVERFLTFERRFFTLPDGTPWIRDEFHINWLYEILLAYATGGYLQIMSPPRHGKSELLTHFGMWLIVRNPNIRILWFGPNDDIIEERVGKLKELLELPEIVTATLAPGRYYAPPKRGPGVTWQKKKFTVACRVPGITGNTVSGMGRGKKMLSMNADLIICDDIEDYESTAQKHLRAGTRRWFSTQLDSRKEEHTPFVVIGSRQHLDDLYSYNLRDPNFRNVVNRAHSKECTKDPHDLAIHVDCMLFPELRSYRWLVSKKVGAETRDEGGTYDMVYLNDPQNEGYSIFIKTEMESALNRSRVLGLSGIPSRDRRLVAGLDPSATGFQAATLIAALPTGIETTTAWTINSTQDRRMRRWLVDVDNRRGGGVDQALALFIDWYDEYQCKHWVIEENGFQRGIRRDPRVKAECERRGIYLEGHFTHGKNKNDPMYGVGAMSRLYRDDLWDLPYGDPATRAIVDQFIVQHLTFTDDAAAQRKRLSDILMSTWFPQKVIRRWEKETVVNDAAVKQIDSAYPVSYPGLDRSGPNSAPWRN